MGISIGHSQGLIAPTGIAALLSGQGQYNQYLQQLNQKWNMQQASIAADAQRQQTQIAASQKQAEFQADHADSNAERQHGFDMERLDAQQGFEREGWGHQDTQRDKQFTNEKGLIDYKLTAQQQSDMNKYQNDLDLIDSYDGFSDEEKEHARRQTLAKMAGIKGVPTEKERNQPNIWTSEEGDKWYEKQPGQWEPIKPKAAEKAPKLTKDLLTDPAFINKVYGQVAKDLGDDATEEDIGTEVDRRLNYLARKAGKDVEEIPQFNGNPDTWTPEMMAAAHAAQPGGYLAAAEKVFNAQQREAAAPQVREPSPMVGGATVPPPGAPPVATAAPSPDDPNSGAPMDDVSMRAMTDPALQGIPAEHRVQVAQDAIDALQELEQAKASGDPAALAAAKQHLAALRQTIAKFAPTDAGSVTVPPRMPAGATDMDHGRPVTRVIIPPLPTSGKPSMAGPQKKKSYMIVNGVKRETQ
ncbi:MAG: hypothetical protein WC100_03320 [Sterolibacterium sp.]